MRKTSYEQIIEWKKRRGGHPRLGAELVFRIDTLKRSVNGISPAQSELLEFVPIRLVTILEVFVRDIVAELVDHSNYFFERGEKLAKGAKVDLAFAAHVDRNELTIGDFVAHSVSFNDVGAVFNILGSLVDDFATKLKSSHPRWTEEINSWPQTPVVRNYDDMMASLNHLYSVRHILTHELPMHVVTDKSNIENFIKATSEFILATDWVIIDVTQGSTPKTQIEMNQIAGNDLEENESILADKVNEIKSLNGLDHQKFDELQEAWENFANQQASLVASQVEGGSMQPMIWAGEKSSLLRERSSQLERIRMGWMDQ